jgi:site-specific recombinase XerD
VHFTKDPQDQVDRHLAADHGSLRTDAALKRQDGGSRYIFMTERVAPMTPAGFR